MIRNILKILAAVIIGYIIGLTIGIIFGAILGFLVSLFFQEIVFSNNAGLMSLAMGIVLGAALGLLATKAVKSMFDTPENPVLGLVFGSALGVIVLLYYGVVYIPNPDVFDQTFYMIPILYGVAVGQYIGSIFFPLISVRGTIHEIIQTHKQRAINEELKNQLSFYRSKKFEKDE